MRIILSILFFLASWRTGAQELTPPQFFLNTDFVYDVESIPNVGFEQFFRHNGRLKSIQVNIGYQEHYSDSFGVVFSHGDRISIGVYQGPQAKFCVSNYSKKHRRIWMNYFSYGLGVKYLWYNKERVNTGHMLHEDSYRIQSEDCFAIVPQFAVGAKRIYRHFCADFYVGMQFPVKWRDKTIYQEWNHGFPNFMVPYNNNHISVTPAPLVGIRLGFVQRKQPALPKQQ